MSAQKFNDTLFQANYKPVADTRNKRSRAVMVLLALGLLVLFFALWPSDADPPVESPGNTTIYKGTIWEDSSSSLQAIQAPTAPAPAFRPPVYLAPRIDRFVWSVPNLSRYSKLSISQPHFNSSGLNLNRYGSLTNIAPRITSPTFNPSHYSSLTSIVPRITSPALNPSYFSSLTNIAPRITSPALNPSYFSSLTNIAPRIASPALNPSYFSTLTNIAPRITSPALNLSHFSSLSNITARYIQPIPNPPIYLGP